MMSAMKLPAPPEISSCSRCARIVSFEQVRSDRCPDCGARLSERVPMDPAVIRRLMAEKKIAVAVA
jgi:hypothetical protein